jgi:protoporphyrinogen oxidase
MRPYNEKIWNCPLSDLSHQWISDRVAMPRLDEVLKGICLNEDQTAWGPNATFRYPRRGGTGIIWQRLTERLPEHTVRYGRRIVAIDREQRLASCQNGERYRYQHLVSTMPLDCLATACQPNHDLKAAGQLKHTTTHVVGLGLRGTPPESLRGRFWGYFSQDKFPFYRLTVMSNLSAENTPTPDETWSLMAEVVESDDAFGEDAMIERVIQGIQAADLLPGAQVILSRWHCRLGHGYPVPTLQRDRKLADVLPRLERDGIYSRGRFGAWKYEVSNQDHSFMQGVEVVDYILFSRPEMTLRQADLVNSRYNAFPFPEWASGS